jgi:hypothetical protein
MEMVIKVKSRVAKNPHANTQYIAVPSSMVQDSQYPFKPDEIVELEIVKKEKDKEEMLVIRKAK